MPVSRVGGCSLKDIPIHNQTVYMKKRTLGLMGIAINRMLLEELRLNDSLTDAERKFIDIDLPLAMAQSLDADQRLSGGGCDDGRRSREKAKQMFCDARLHLLTSRQSTTEKMELLEQISGHANLATFRNCRDVSPVMLEKFVQATGEHLKATHRLFCEHWADILAAIYELHQTWKELVEEELTPAI